MGALIFAFWQWAVDRKRLIEHEEKAQASTITCWIEQSYGDQPTDTGQQVSVRMVISNTSNNAISRVVIAFAPFTALPIDRLIRLQSSSLGKDERIFSVLPPGKWKIPVPEGWRGMSRSPGVEISFTDSANNHWARTVDGTLLRMSKDAIRRRGITFPQGFSIPISYDA